MVRRRQTQPGMIGSAARRSMRTVAATSTALAGEEAERGRGEPGPGDAALHERGQQQCRRRRRRRARRASRRGGAGRRPSRPRGSCEVAHDQPEGDRADGQVDQEDPAPVGVGGEQPAERGAGDGRGGPDRGELRLDLRAFLERVEVGGEGLDGALEGAAAQALHDAEGDQRRHVPGARAEQRAEQEEDDAGDQDRLAAEGVGELAVDGQGDGDGEQVAGEQPGEDGEAAEVAHDLRDRGGDDRGVEGGERHGQHEGGDDRAAPARAGRSRRGAGAVRGALSRSVVLALFLVVRLTGPPPQLCVADTIPCGVTGRNGASRWVDAVPRSGGGRGAGAAAGAVSSCHGPPPWCGLPGAGASRALPLGPRGVGGRA